MIKKGGETVINFSALDLKTSLMDLTSKSVNVNEIQVDFQDTLKSNLDNDKKTVAKNAAKDMAEKAEPLNNKSVKNSKKEIPLVDETMQTTNDVSDMEQLENKIIHMVAKALGIDSEELKNILESLEIEPAELLNLENLQSLILQLTGNETMIQLLAQPKELTGPITELISELSKLSADDSVQKIVDSNQSDLFMKTQEVPTAQLQGPNELANQNQLGTESGQAQELDTVNGKQDTEGNVVNTSNFEEELNNFANHSGEHEKGKSDTGDSGKTVLTSDELIQNITKFTQNVQNVDKFEQAVQGNQVDYVEVVEQIVEQIRVSIKPEVTRMEMQLNPENLGRLNLEISSRDGVLKAHFTVQDQVVKEALESQMTQLKETLTAQGLKIESIEVKLSNLAYDPNGHKQQQEQQQQNKRFHLKDQDSEEEGIMIEEIRRELEIEKSTVVDYSA